MSEPISLDGDAARQAVQQWHDYAEQVKAYGGQHHMSIEEIRASVGDTYAPFVEAKQAEMEAREAAYARMSAQARGHAERLSNTVTIFETTDEDSVSKINRILDA